jgi:hypothetical protein
VLSWVDDAAKEDMLPPEWEEETRICFVDLTSVLRCIVCGGQASGCVGDGRTVRREGMELLAASVLNFFTVPVRGTGGAESKDESHTGPEVVNHRAGELKVAVHGRKEGRPLLLQGEQVGISREGLREGRVSDGGRAARDGQGAAAPDGVEVLSLGESEHHLVSKGS